MKTLNFLSLFSGIAGFEKGIEEARVNWNCIGFSDIYKPSVKIYKKNYPGHKELGDLTTILPKKKLEGVNVDILLAGFCCQPYSVAGKREGLNDDRGQLIYRVFDIVKAKKPSVIFLENVKGLVSQEDGSTLDRIVREIDELGYDVNYEVLNTVNYGLPHNGHFIHFGVFKPSFMATTKSLRNNIF